MNRGFEASSGNGSAEELGRSSLNCHKTGTPWRRSPRRP